MSIDSSGIITLNDPTPPSDTSVPDTLTYYFKCEDLDNTGTFVENDVTFTINDPSIVSSSISAI